LKVARLLPDAILPTRKTLTDAGLDLYLYAEDRSLVMRVPSRESRIFHTGITIEIPEGYAGFIWPKSRYDFLIGGGVIDSGYQGEIFVKVINPGFNTLYFEHGQAIAQIIFQRVLIEPLEEVPVLGIHLKNTARGATGGIVRQSGSK
jgi:dUTP pyrophosphatase